MQGQAPRHLLLAALRAQIGSVLLATQSFWEGVDVPGEALSLVVIDRIPFAVPDDPLMAARIDRIRDGDGEPFLEYQLPRAALALKQGFGRLIRSRADRGIVALLDGRVGAQALRRDAGRQPAPRLPAHRAAGRRRAFLGSLMTDPLATAGLVVGAYLVGSIPFGLVLARAKGIDLREVGSGNIGATNVARAMGKGWAVLVLLADAAKGFLPVWLGHKLGLAAPGHRARRRCSRSSVTCSRCFCAAGAARGSPPRWASRWRCRRSRR